MVEAVTGELSTITPIRGNVNFALREGETDMSNNWMTTAEAVTVISKHSHHAVSPHYVQTLVNRGKIGTRSSYGGTIVFKRSDVEATRVAAGRGKTHGTERERSDVSWVAR